MERPTCCVQRWTRRNLRGLRDPVRSLADAVEDIAADLKAEAEALGTSPQRRAEIGVRLLLVRSVAKDARLNQRKQAVLAYRHPLTRL
jgi:hypothetical protein